MTPASQALADVADERLTIIRLEDDDGLQHAKNVGIGNATGEYLAFLDDDDVWLPEKLERQLRFVNARQVDGCVTLKRVVDEEGTTIPDTGYMSRYRALMGDLKTQPMSTLLIRRKPVTEIDGFDESFPFQHEDREFCVRILDRASIGVLEAPLIEVHRDGRTPFPEPDALIEGKRALLNKHEELLSSFSLLDQRRILSFNRLELALSLCHHGEPKRSLALFRRALVPPVLSPQQYLFYLAVFSRTLFSNGVRGYVPFVEQTEAE